MEPYSTTCGIFDRKVQRCLLQQVDLTFINKAVEEALAAEAADKDSRRLMQTTSDKG